MKKIMLVLSLILVTSLGFAQTIEVGLGNPVGRSMEAGSLYINQLTNRVWIANTTAKGDFTELPSMQQLKVGYTTLNVADSITADEVDADLRYGTNYVVSSGTADVVNVADSQLTTQDLTIIFAGEATETDTLVVTPETGAAGTITLENVDEYVYLKWINGKWVTMKTTGTEN